MKFKNYKNSYNNDNRIYSKNELLDMSLRELGGREKELLAQYDSIGIPDDEELSSSSNVVYVNAYTRDDGTEVKAHWRSKPNSGSAIDGQSTGGAAKIKTEKNEQTYKPYDGLTATEKLQKAVSKHISSLTPSEYYGISEYLADEGKVPEKYLKNNYYYKLGDIKNTRTKEIIANKVIKARRDCPVDLYTNSTLDDVDVIIPKNDSEIVQEVKSSAELYKFVQKNYDKLKSGQVVNGSINFEKPLRNENYVSYYIKNKEKVNLFTVLHYTDIKDVKMNSDKTISMKLVDYYDFTELNKGDIFNLVNNNAYKQQKLGKLKPYVLYFEFKYYLNDSIK